MFPSLRGEKDWWNIDLDFRSLFPQRYARIMGEIEICASFPRSTMEGERRENVLAQGRRRRGVFIPPPIKMTVTASQAGLSAKKSGGGGRRLSDQNWQKIHPHLVDAHKSP
jgi:hypothetical protein